MYNFLDFGVKSGDTAALWHHVTPQLLQLFRNTGLILLPYLLATWAGERAVIPGLVAAAMSFWKFVYAAQEDRGDYRGMIGAVLEKTWHIRERIGEKGDHPSRGQDKIDLVV